MLSNTEPNQRERKYNMFFNVLTSEFTKLRTTRSFWTNLVFFALMTVGFNAGLAFLFKKFVTDTPGATMNPLDVAPMINMPGAMIMGIMAILMITNEYSSKYISVSFLATPNRVKLALAKLVLMMVVAAALAFVAQALGIALTRLIVGAEYGPRLVFTDKEVQGYLWKSPVYAAMFVMFAQGLAWLVRSAVVAIVILLGWYMTLETMVLPMLYKVGQKITPYAPFKNLSAFYKAEHIDKVPWDQWGSLAYFGVWALVLYTAGVLLLWLRDA